jgi:hypothetical protein
MEDFNLTLLDDDALISESIENDEAEEQEELEEEQEEQEDEQEEGNDEESEDEEGDEEEGEVRHDIYMSLADVLKEKGFFGDIDTKKITSADELASAFKKEIKKNEYADLNERQIRLLEAMRDGVPEEEIISEEQELENIMSITDRQVDENENLSYRLIMNDLMLKGLSQSKAQKMYDMFLDDGDDKREAREALRNLQDQTRSKYDEKVLLRKQEKESRARQADEFFDKVTDKIKGTESFLGSYKVTDLLKDKVIANMSKPIGVDSNGVAYNALMKAKTEDPIDFESKLYYLFTITNGFKDLTGFEKRATSKAVRDLESKLNSIPVDSSGKQVYQSGPRGFQPEIVKII